MTSSALFLSIDQQANMPGVLAVLIGTAVDFLIFTKAERERHLVEEYHQKNMTIARLTGQAEP
jgi:hypothetical protein